MLRYGLARLGEVGYSQVWKFMVRYGDVGCGRVW